MNYVIVDDEKSSVTLLEILLKEYESFNEGDSITGFTDSRKALQWVETHPVDVLFLDIEMPGLNGIDFAEKVIETFEDAPEIIFITAYATYSLKAWELSAFGYILKPYEAKQIYDVLNRYLRYHQVRSTDPAQEKASLDVRAICFPNFALLVHGQPVEFPNKKSRELLALLVHHKGNWVDLGEIAFSLFEEEDEASSKKYCRTILWRLKKTLKPFGLDDIIDSQYGKMRVKTDRFSCDYYEYLSGNETLYQGEYMGIYPWAQERQAAMWAKHVAQE